MDILLMILGCRPTTPGERRVIVALLRIGLALGAAVQLYPGYFIERPEAEMQRGLGYVLLATTLLIPVVLWTAANFIDERF